MIRAQHKELARQIQKMLKDEIAVADIAIALNISIKSVYRHIHGYNLKFSKYVRRKTSVSKYNTGEFIRFCETHQLSEIREQYGNYAADLVVKKHYKYIPRVAEKRALEIVQELRSGKSQSAIARKHNVSRQYVHILKNKYLGE